MTIVVAARRCAVAAILAAIVILPAGAAHCAAPAGKPNIIFIMADDLGYGDLGCYGQEMIQTPHLDRMAAEGTRFTRVYAGSCVCAPSRCCLLTGMHNGHARIRDNVPHGVFLKSSDVTIAEVLKEAGYRTAAVGKWSLGVHGSQGKPNDQGFDDWFGHLDQDQAHFYYPDHLWDNDRVVLLPGNRGDEKRQYTHDLFTERALEFVRQSKAAPFFLYLAYTLPHWSDYPRNSDDSLIVPSDEPYGDRDWPQVERNYAAMVTRMDRDVGRIMALLDELGLDETTAVFFTSDNGPSAEAKHRPAFFNSAGGLRGVKRDLYEGGIRVPMIVRWPGRVPAAATSDQVWTFWDVMPTLAEMAHAPTPAAIDGISKLPALLGQSQSRTHEYLYWDYGHARPEYLQAVLSGRWKGIRSSRTKRIELFDLDADPSESNDVAASHSRVVAKIESLMREARGASDDY